MKSIVVEFSGWAKMSADDATFVRINDEDAIPEIISGDVWSKMPEDKQSDYILEDVIAFQRDADDGEYEDISISIEEEY